MFVMQKLGLRGAVLLFVLAVLMAVPAAETGMVAAAAAGTMPAPALLVDGRPATPAVPLFWDEGTVLVSLRDLGAFLGAGLQWNGAAKTAWIQKYGHTVFFRLQTDEVLKNGKVVAAPAAARLVGGTVYVPLRFVAENLGAAVAWEGGARQVQIVTGERRAPHERVNSQATFNALVAYTDQGRLWLLDGREPGAVPRQLTADGYAEIIGWSVDGTWLAYKHAAGEGAEPAYLWVVQADGSGARQVDTAPVGDDAHWSPGVNRLAYTTRQKSADGYIPTGLVRCAAVTAAGIEAHTLLEADVVQIPSLAWHPAGESLAVSLPRTGERPPALEQAFLDGRRETLYTYRDGEPVDLEGLYPWALISLQWSPDGEFLAYHLRLNSASLTADAVEAGVLKVAAEKTVSLGGGLRHREWLAFSPDSEQLAYIAGTGRDVMYNKRLEKAVLAAGEQPADYGREGFVDTQPVWLPAGPAGEPPTLLFCRGTEVNVAANLNTLPAVMVPGQRIYKLDGEGQLAALTAGPADTADYFPSPAPSGAELLFLRLERFDQGSLYLQPLNAPDQAVEILRGLKGSPGFYGSYYPGWACVHWF
jgi:hypothetical protein